MLHQEMGKGQDEEIDRNLPFRMDKINRENLQDQGREEEAEDLQKVVDQGEETWKLKIWKVVNTQLMVVYTQQQIKLNVNLKFTL